MKTTKKIPVLIGIGAAAVSIAILLFLPVIPIVWAGSTNQSSQAQSACEAIASGKVLGTYPQPNFLQLNSARASISLKVGQMHNGSYTQYAPQYWNSTSGKWIKNGTDIFHKHGITNYTGTFDLGSLTMSKFNSTVSRLDAVFYSNGTLDSFVHVKNLVLTVTEHNSTLHALLTIGHVSLLYGQGYANYSGSGSPSFGVPPFPIGISFSLDNLKIAYNVNCITGKSSYGMVGTTNGMAIGNIVSTIIGHRLTGTVALPSFSGATS